MSRKFPAPSAQSLLLIALLTVLPMAPIMAAELPLAAASPLAGFSFDDRPLLLPVQQNFQMGMLTASSELGRSCGKMEAYGWRMGASEQDRVNQIFNNTVDRLRGLGYSVEAEAPTSVSRDITMFSADRSDKHFLFMWSAGEIGLVMTLCESSPPVSRHLSPDNWASAQKFPSDVVESKLEAPFPNEGRKNSTVNFSPVGTWAGDYSCAQGYFGATMKIDHLYHDKFDGTFHFYPTNKNPHAPEGVYDIYGQYDRDSQRILINPGKWLEHPRDTVSTVMVGSFDAVRRTFSAYFQGLTGCTSFEAKGANTPAGKAELKRERRSKASAKKKAVAKKIIHPATAATAPVGTTTPIVPPSDVAPIPSTAPASVPPAASPTTTAPALQQAPMAVTPPASVIPQPAPTTLAAPPATVPNQTGAPLQVVPPNPQTAAPTQGTPPLQTAPTTLTVPPPSPFPATDTGGKGIALPQQ